MFDFCRCLGGVGILSQEESSIDERVRIQRRTRVEQYWRLPWDEFEIMLGMRNPMLQRAFPYPTFERAGRFLGNSGFNPSRKSDCYSFEQFYCEAMFFIRHVLMSFEERQSFSVPQPLLQLDDPRKLFLYASDRGPRRRYLRLWSCALIKVFYAIANLEYSDRLRDIDAAKEQIFGRLRDLLVTQEDGTQTMRFSETEVDLAALEWKEAKTRASIILKLLHKPDGAIDEVFDYLGVRFVVRRENDLPRLLKILVDSDFLIPGQVIGTRTRNSLFNARKARQLCDLLFSLSSMGTIDGTELEGLFERIPWTYRTVEDLPRSRNLFSSSEYRSLQLTVRHLVRLPNPAYAVVDSLAQQVRHYRGLERDDSSFSAIVPSEVAKYFPIEIQIMDAEAHELAKTGSASHEQYKAAQLKVVRDRVLSGMLNFDAERLQTQEI
jgi:uncharacterized protein (TIGR04562 family)